MWPFSKPNTIEKSGLLNGFTDWHSHILPGVDDGFQSPEASLELLKAYENAGVRKIWFTPHVMEDYPNTTGGLRECFEEFTKLYTGPIELRLASENMLDNLFEERLQSRDFLPIGDEGRHLLVETSYINPPYAMDDMLEGLMKAGYTPILAHPERYRYMDMDDYTRLKEMGILFQMNFVSLTGGYGETARKKSEWLLKNGMIDLTGSDIHRMRTFEHFSELRPRKNDHLESLKGVAANPVIE